MPHLRLIDSIAQPCKVANEDLFDHDDQAAWIFDGASGIGPKIMADAPTDPYWLVQTFNRELRNVWSADKPTRDLLSAAAEGAIEQFRIQAPDPAPPLIDRPTACFLMARLWRGALELSAVGDCWLLHRSGAVVTEFGDKIGDVAAPVHQELARLKAAGVAGDELFQRLLPLERQFRAKANTDGGYAILDLTKRWVDRIAQQVREVQSGDSLLLMTDGFYRLIDTFGAYNSGSLMEAAHTTGLAALLEQLRGMEDRDQTCSAFPRAKVRDDVTAALLTIE